MKKIEMFENVLDQLAEAYKIENRAEVNAARAAIYDSIPSENKKFFESKLFDKYCEAKNIENDLLDFDDWTEGKTDELLALLKELGVEEITVSSTWSGTVEWMYELVTRGCVLKGMVQVNSCHKDYKNGGYEKKAAFLLSI